MNEYRIAKEWIDRITPKDKNFWASRESEHVVFRNCIAFLLRDKTRLSLQKIGRLLNKNHATIIHAIKNNKERVWSGRAFDEDYRMCYENLLKTFPMQLKRECLLQPNNEYWEINLKLYNSLIINH